MDGNARAELAAIKRELNSIISELDNIAIGIRRDFKGIGNEQCANCVGRAAEQYRWVKSKLDTMDTTTVTDSYAAAHSTE